MLVHLVTSHMQQPVPPEWEVDGILPRCRYEGTWCKGMRDGHGKCKYASEDLYDGAWSNDMRAGNGTCAYANGDKYTGDSETLLLHTSMCVLPMNTMQTFSAD